MYKIAMYSDSKVGIHFFSQALDSKTVMSVLYVFNFNITRWHPFLNILKTRIHFFESQSCIFVRHMNKQLGVIGIKVSFSITLLGAV